MAFPQDNNYLDSLGVSWDRQEILEAYMIMAGVPFYYSVLETDKSLAENVDDLFFKSDGQLRLEFDELFSALFTNADLYQKAVKILGLTPCGVARPLELPHMARVARPLGASACGVARPLGLPIVFRCQAY